MSIVIEIAATNDADDSAITWTDITPYVVLRTEDDGGTFGVGGEALQGSVGTGSGFDLSDDAGTRVLRGKRVIRATETATTPDTVLFRGRIGDRGSNRGTRWFGSARQLDVSLVDYNADLGGILVNNWARPLETDVDRITAVVDTYLNGNASTKAARARSSTKLAKTYLDTGNTTQVHSETYKGSNPYNVIADVLGWTTKVFFVTVDGEIYYDLATDTGYAATLSITDVAADSSTSFAPIPDGNASDESPSEFVSGILGTFNGTGSYYHSDPAIAALHDKWEESVSYETAVGDKAEASVLRDLGIRKYEERTYHCKIKLTAAQVGMVKYGQTLSFRWAAAGVTTDTTVRVMRLMWTIAGIGPSGVASYYAHLELKEPRAIGTGGGGGAPTAPWEPCTPAVSGVTLVQSTTGGVVTGHTAVFTNNPTPGNLGVVWLTRRDSGLPGTPTGFTLIDTIAEPSTSRSAGLAYRIFQTGDTKNGPVSGGVWGTESGTRFSMAEFAGGYALDTSAKVSGTLAHAAVPFTAAATASLVAGVVAWRFGATDPNPVVDDAGSTSVYSDGNYGADPYHWAGYKESTGGSVTIGATAAAAFDFAAVAASFILTDDPNPAAECPPPVPGQPVAPQEIPVTDCVMRAFTTPFPYMSGSLRVWKRNDRGELIPILGFEETDPDAGLFTLNEPACGTVREQVILTGYDAGLTRFVPLTSSTGRILTGYINDSPTGSVLVVAYQAGSGVETGVPVTPPTPTPPPSAPPTGTANVANGLSAAAFKAAVEANAGLSAVSVLSAGGSYSFSSMCTLAAAGIVIDMNGATITQTANVPAFKLDGCTDFSIDNGIVQGADSTGVYHAGDEDAHGFHVAGGSNIRFKSRLTIRNFRGDGLYFAQSGTTPGTGTTVEDGVHIGPVGRMGIAPVAFDHGTIGKVVFVGRMYRPLDFEPDTNVSYTQTVRHWTVDGAIVNCYVAGSDGSGTGWLYAGTPYSGHAGNLPVIDDITVKNCRVTSLGPTSPHNAMAVEGGGDAVISNVVITDNVSTNDWGNGLAASTVSTLTVTGNVMGAPNSTYTATGSTGVTITGNT